MKITIFFLLLLVIFALLDPDPDPLTQMNPDPQPWFNYLEVSEAALAGGPADAPEAQGGQIQTAPRCSQSAQAVLPLLQD